MKKTGLNFIFKPVFCMETYSSVNLFNGFVSKNITTAQMNATIANVTNTGIIPIFSTIFWN